MESKEIDRQLMLDYIQGNCSSSQLHRVREYLHDEAYRESLDKFLLEEWEAISRSPQPLLPGMELKYHQFQFYRSSDGKASATLPSAHDRDGKAPASTRSDPMHSDPIHSASTPPAPIRRLRVSRFVRLAAAAAVLFLLILSAWLLQPGRSGRGSRNSAGQWTSLHNEPGKKNTIFLPDSSLVYLGTASTLKYNADYNRTGRKILLEGEAYFVVRHDGHQPFTVVTGDIATVDIGTEFNIRYYPGKSSIEVEVAKGKVEVRSTKGGSDTRIAALGQGQGLLYDTVTARSMVSVLPDTGLIGAWRKGILSFRKRPMKEVTDELERYYGVSIRYANPAIGNILITTLLDNNTLQDALEIVTVTAEVRYTRKGNIIFLDEAPGHGPAKK